MSGAPRPRSPPRPRAREQRAATGLSGFTRGAGNVFGIGPGIQLPIFTGGRIRSHIAVQDARLQPALRIYEQEVLAALEETENALAAYRHEQDRNASLAAGVSASRQAVGLAREVLPGGPGRLPVRAGSPARAVCRRG